MEKPVEKKGSWKESSTSDFNNPCLKEHKLSLKCLNDNNFEKEKCEIFFENYKVCRSFWSHVKKERHRKGIEPHLPPPEERARIKEEYFRKAKKALNMQ